MTDDRYQGLKQLGANTKQPNSPEEAVLERVPAVMGGKKRWCVSPARNSPRSAR